jgi:hypothetical protein
MCVKNEINTSQSIKNTFIQLVECQNNMIHRVDITTTTHSTVLLFEI